MSHPILTQSRPPKIDNIEAHFDSGSKFQAYISTIGCLHVLRPTENPVMVRDINVSQKELELRTTPKVRQGCAVSSYGLMMESMIS